MISTFQRFRIDGKTNYRWCKFCRNHAWERLWSITEVCKSEKLADLIPRNDGTTFSVPMFITAEIEMYVYEHGCAGFEMSLSRLAKEV